MKTSEPGMPGAKREPSSLAQATISIERRGRSPCAAMACTASNAASTPNTPSNFPPVGCESIWEPASTGASRGSRPSKRRNRLAMRSVNGERPSSRAQATSCALASLSIAESAGRSTPPSSRAPNRASAMWRAHKRSPSTSFAGEVTGTTVSIGPHDLRGIGARIAPSPSSRFHLRDELGEVPVEQVGFFKIEGMACLRKDGETGARNGTLEEQAGLKTMVVLIADHHQYRRLHGTELGFEIIKRRPPHLHAAHGVGGTSRIVLCQAIGEQSPATRVLFLKLHARGAFGIDRRKILRTTLLEIVSHLRRDALEIILMDFLSAIACTGSDSRQHAARMAKRHMQGRKSAHRKANDMRFLDSCSAQHIDDVVRRAGLRVGIDLLGDIRRRIATGGEGDALMPPRKEIELRLPAPMAAAEFMNENDRRAGACAFVEEVYPIAGFREAHGNSFKSRSGGKRCLRPQ